MNKVHKISLSLLLLTMICGSLVLVGPGLYISKKIAEAHGGTIDVKSLTGVIPNKAIIGPEGSLTYAS